MHAQLDRQTDRTTTAILYPLHAGVIKYKHITKASIPLQFPIKCIPSSSPLDGFLVQNINTPTVFACDEESENYGKYFPMNATGHVTEKLISIFFPTF